MDPDFERPPSSRERPLITGFAFYIGVVLCLAAIVWGSTWLVFYVLSFL